MTSVTRKKALYNWDFNDNFWIEVETFDSGDTWDWNIYSEYPVGDISASWMANNSFPSEEGAVRAAIEHLENIYCREDEEDYCTYSEDCTCRICDWYNK